MNHRPTIRPHTRLLAVIALSATGCGPDPAPPPPTTSTTTTTTTTATTTTTTTTTVPAVVAITASSPASPSTSLAPLLSGSAPAETTTIRLFASTDCSGPTIVAGDLATFSGVGLPVSVGPGTTTPFTAFASGVGVAACSAPFEYVNTLTPP